MSFDKVIGYAQTKKALLPLLQMLQGDNRYNEIGAILPHGVIFCGEPNVGKTLFAKTLIEESRCHCVELEADKLTESFSQAAAQEKTILFLDNVAQDRFPAILKEMDKPENAAVFVLVTTSKDTELTDDILRPGHFSFAMSIPEPEIEDTEQMLMHLLTQIKEAPELDVPALTKMMKGLSYPTLQTVINDAAMQAAFVGEYLVNGQKIVESYIRNVQSSPDSVEGLTLPDTMRTAYHEAGHTVISEVLHPGTVTLVYLRRGPVGTYGKTCYYLPAVESSHMSVKRDSVIKTLAGRAITELKFGEIDTGCCRDLLNAFRTVQDMVVDRCSLGFANGVADGWDDPSEEMKAQRERVVAQEMEHYYTQAKELLAANMPFVNAVAQALLEKETLTQADIRAIREQLG